MNSVPAHSYFGAPVSGIRPAAHVSGAKMAAASGPYLGEQSRKNMCRANNDTCKARQAKGTDLCFGHLRSSKKAEDGS